LFKSLAASSVADAQRVDDVAGRVVETFDKEMMFVGVVSAQGDTTDILIDKAMEINPSPSKRKWTFCCLRANRFPVALLAMVIEKLGRPVVSLTGWQVGMRTDSSYSNARIKRISSGTASTRS
jgi:aspartate kinase